MPLGSSSRRSVRVAGPFVIRLIGAALLAVAGCSSPTAPTPPPPPPSTQQPPPILVDPPTIACPPSVGDTASSDNGASMIFSAPRVEAGAAPVNVSCTHTSGSNFPVGVTTVECTATDAMNRSASCQLQVAVAPSLKIAATKFVAFGDSISAAEVAARLGGVHR